jgi:hypothetical protein
MSNPCTYTTDPTGGGHGSSCSVWPPDPLEANGMVVGIWRHSFPGWSFAPDAGSRIEIAGHVGTWAIGKPDAGCAASGGDEQITVIVPDLEWNWQQVDACLRGPDHATNEDRVRQMLGLA